MKNEYVELVQELNWDLHDKWVECPYAFTYTFDGIGDYIYFQDFLIWSSENDERDFDEDMNCYEPLEDFVKKEFNKLIKDLQKLKF